MCVCVRTDAFLISLLLLSPLKMFTPAPVAKMKKRKGAFGLSDPNQTKASLLSEER